MNIFEYFIERKRLNILDKELNSCNSRISKLTKNIYYDIDSNNITRYMTLIETENRYRDWLKEELNNDINFGNKNKNR